MLGDIFSSLRQNLNFHHRIYVVLFFDLLLVLYVRLVVQKLRSGGQRLWAALPAVLVTCVLPLLFSRETEVVTLVAVAFLHVWLTNFKVLGLALDRGPLTLPLSPLQFATVLLAPITPQLDSKMHRVGSQGRLADNGGSSAELLVRFAAKTAGLCGVVFCLSAYSPPDVFREILYALGLYLFLGSFMDGPATAVTALIGLNIAPHFNQPYISPSIASFWGSRWNLTAANTLRFLVYDTLCDGRAVAAKARRLPVRATQEMRALAMMASFTVSGLVHEVMYWYCQGYMTGSWLVFFSLQGPLILAEMAGQRLMRKRQWHAPRAARVAITLTVLMAVGHFYFFPPAVHGGLADRVCDSIKDSFASLYAYASTMFRQ